MNKEIELLHKKIEAQDKIINTQALEIARLKEQLENDIDRYEDTISYQLGFDKGKEQLQQENKQLKEEIENIKDFNNKLQASKDRLDKDDYNLAHILTELEEWLQSIIYEIEPMGCSINYNCEYDSEEDYINAMKEQSKLNILKIIKDKIQELKEKYK